jgi:hypothetical protein
VRYAKKRDTNDGEIFKALQVAGCNPVRCTDLEVKYRNGKLRDLQLKLQAIFKDRYRVVRSVEQALAACGRLA